MFITIFKIELLFICEKYYLENKKYYLRSKKHYVFVLESIHLFVLVNGLC